MILKTTHLTVGKVDNFLQRSHLAVLPETDILWGNSTFLFKLSVQMPLQTCLIHFSELTGVTAVASMMVIPGPRETIPPIWAMCYTRNNG